MKNNKKKFSIIVPVYQNAGSLDWTIPELLKLEKILTQYKLELVFVDDGSTDASYEYLLRHHLRHPDRIRIVKLTRNFGQNKAILAGLSVATGDCTGIISADLQDPPELFLEMIARWERGTKLVIAERKGRDDKGGMSLLSNLYWYLLRKYAIKDFPAGGFDFCLFDREVRDQLTHINEKNPVVFPLIFWLGYAHEIITYQRKARKAGKSQWSFGKKLKLTVDTFINFTYVPVKFISILGISVSFFSFSYAFVVFFKRLFWEIEIQGWSTIVILISCFGGLILFSLGIIGEYLWRILEETRSRPNSVIDRIVEKNDPFC